MATAVEPPKDFDGLHADATSRHTIDLAIGILMGRYEMEPDAALRILVGISNATDITLGDVAATVVSEAVARQAHE